MDQKYYHANNPCYCGDCAKWIPGYNENNLGICLFYKHFVHIKYACEHFDPCVVTTPKLEPECISLCQK
jgi:hypothetical protein